MADYRETFSAFGIQEKNVQNLKHTLPKSKSILHKLYYQIQDSGFSVCINSVTLVQIRQETLQCLDIYTNLNLYRDPNLKKLDVLAGLLVVLTSLWKKKTNKL